MAFIARYNERFMWWDFLRQHALDLTVMALAVWVQVQFSRWIAEAAFVGRHAALRNAVHIAGFLAAAWVAFGVAGSIPAVHRRLAPSEFVWWVRGAGVAWCLASVGAFVIIAACRRVPGYSDSRRGFVRATGMAMASAPFGAMAFGILVQRNDIRVREVDVPIANLPKDLNGLRIVQFSDIHLSPFLSESRLARAVDMANETRADLAVVTGDLITGRGDPLDACLRQLARLRATAGTLGCLGNHEIYAGAEDAAAEMGARLGIQFLRRDQRLLRFGRATLSVTGVDYQRSGGRPLRGLEDWIIDGSVNVLLSHNPVFDQAAGQGWDLTLSGHTHGGQVTVEILNQNISAARFYTPYVYGLYRRGRSSIWVTRGIGTVGVPARLGAPPEIALLRLCDTSS